MFHTNSQTLKPKTSLQFAGHLWHDGGWRSSLPQNFGCGIWLFYLFGPSGLCDFAFLSFTLRGAIHSRILSVFIIFGGGEGRKEHQNAEIYENYNIKLYIKLISIYIIIHFIIQSLHVYISTWMISWTHEPPPCAFFFWRFWRLDVGWDERNPHVKSSSQVVASSPLEAWGASQKMLFGRWYNCIIYYIYIIYVIYILYIRLCHVDIVHLYMYIYFLETMGTHNRHVEFFQI